MQIGDLVKFVDTFRQNDRGIGVVVGMELRKFEPIVYRVCFPNSKKEKRNHVIRVARTDMYIVSDAAEDMNETR